MEYYWKKKTMVSFLLSIFVLLIHMSSFSQYAITGTSFEGITSVVNVFFRKSFVLLAVPLFFVISGATYFRNYTNKDYKRRLISRAKSLLVPYLIWNTLNMLFEITTSYTFISNYFIGREKFVISVPNILLGIFFYDCNGPFWFIFNLMIFVIASPLLDVILSKKWLGLSVIAVLIALQIFNINLPEKIFFEAESLVYYLIGAYIGKYHFCMFSAKSTKRTQKIGAAGFITSTAILFVQEMSLFTFPDAINAIVKSAGAISLWFFLDCLIDKVTQKNYMDDSFIIYALHVNVSAVLIKLFYLALPKHPLMSILNLFVCTALTVALICVFCAILKKFLPKVYAIVSGARARTKSK